LTNKLITIITPLIIVGVAISSFILNFTPLMELGVRAGFEPDRVFLVPIVIECSLAAFSLYRVYAAYHGYSGAWHWVPIALYTVLSIGFSIVHAPYLDLVAYVIRASVSGTLFLSVEVLCSIVTQIAKAGQIVEAKVSLENLVKQVRANEAKLAASEKAVQDMENIRARLGNKTKELTDTSETLAQKRERLAQAEERLRQVMESTTQAEESLRQLEETHELAEGVFSQETTGERVLMAREAFPGKTQNELAAMIGVTPGTVSKALKNGRQHA
jgi:exonuclease VII small subunit